MSLNTLAMTLSALRVLDRLADLVDRTTDDVGLLVSHDDLPKRMAPPRRNTSPAPLTP